jgi:nucleoid DNA-binding protein
MNKTINTDEFISSIAKRASFAKKDVQEILNAIVAEFENAVENGDTIKVYGFGKMYSQPIPPRKGMKGQDLPETQRVIFRLSENIRYKNKK